VRRGRRQGLGPLYRRGAAAVTRGGKNPAAGTAAGTWPHRPVLPTVGVTPDAVGYNARCTFLENFDSTIYFSKIITK
jgi:hypothetical protein